MANLILRSRLKEATANRSSKPDGRCKKHPKHKQSPGVCSVCLSEKLSQLSASSSSSSSSFSTTLLGRNYSSSSSTASSCYSSFSGSSCSSPVHTYRFAGKDQGKGSSLSSMLFLGAGKHVLTKSRSLAFVPRMSRGAEDKNKKKKSGFWSKLLLRARSGDKRKEEGLVHSRTTREKATAITSFA